MARRAAGNRDRYESNGPKTNSLLAVFCAADTRFAVRGLRALSGRRIADQQQVIANLVTVDSEQRLGQTLLQLARTMGKKDPRSIRIELKITHEELSEMVGTTRPRISLFMQRFHNLGLIETNRDQVLRYQRKKTHRLSRSDRLKFQRS